MALPVEPMTWIGLSIFHSYALCYTNFIQRLFSNRQLHLPYFLLTFH